MGPPTRSSEDAGPGPGATDPLAENSFTCMMGSAAAEIVAAGFKANQSIIAVIENLQIPLWAPITSLTMTSDFKTLFRSHLRGSSGALLLVRRRRQNDLERPASLRRHQG